MKTVACYISGVPPSKKNNHKAELLQRFADGVRRAGDHGISHMGNSIIDSDVAVIQGWVHENSPNTPHLVLRKSVVETQKKLGKHTIIIDSNLFNYKDKDHPIKYHRYSLDGVFPTTGNYFWDDPDPAKWKQISNHLGLSLKDYRTSGNHILICTQRNGGWSMKGLPVQSWLEYTVMQIKKYTDRPIIVRAHPGDKSAPTHLIDRPGKYTISKNAHILDDFKNAWAVVVHNSTPSVAATIEGVPTFITDPDPRNSQAYGVTNTDISQIENPKIFDRQQWVEKLAMCHFHLGEVSSGDAWKHIRKYI